MRRLTLLAVIATLFGVALTTYAYTRSGTPTGFVNDFANILTADQRTQLETKLNAFEKATTNEISIVTVPSLGGDTIENYAVQLFADWGIGKKGKDNGLLILVAPTEHKMRIEVGYGLEGDVTDAQSSWIIKDTMTPAFKNGDYFGGLNGAVDQIIGAISGGQVIPSDTSSDSSSGKFNISFNTFLFLLFIPIYISSILARSKSWWAGGVVGGIIGVIVGFLYGSLMTGLISSIFLIPLGLLFDFMVSRNYAKHKAAGTVIPWWIGGGRGGGSGFGGGGGFGGFGGGMSGGGGSSGSW